MFWRESNTPAFLKLAFLCTCWWYTVVATMLSIDCDFVLHPFKQKKVTRTPVNTVTFQITVHGQGYLTKWSQILGLVRWCEAVKPAELALRMASNCQNSDPQQRGNMNKFMTCPMHKSNHCLNNVNVTLKVLRCWFVILGWKQQCYLASSQRNKPCRKN